VSGTPVDCIRLALFQLATDIDVVLSGVNEGGNLGADIWFSGTVAAAREAAFFRRPAIAVSQYRLGRGKPFPIDRAAHWTHCVLTDLLQRNPSANAFWNVNLPDPPDHAADCPPIVHCKADDFPLPVAYELRDGKFHYSGSYHQRERAPGSDVATCFGGEIAVSLLELPG
jgi:5'-nucleotidase